VIPLAIALLPLIWGLTAAFIKRIQFRKLILREIEEIGPHPPKRVPEKQSWTEAHSKAVLT
jgi:hypothetical protein